MRSPLTTNIAQAICAAICVGMLVLFGLITIRGGLNILGSDLTGYYTAATIVSNGDGRSLYDINVQKAVQAQLIYPTTMREGLLPFEYPPWDVLPFLPLARLPYNVAYGVWFLVNVALFIVGLRLFTSALPAIEKNTNLLAAMWLAAASFFPLFIALILGQLTIVVFLGYALCFIALKKGNGFRAGLALTLALVKPQLVLALPILLVYKRRWRALLGLALGLGILAIASVLIVGIPRLDDYISIVRFAAGRYDWRGDLAWNGLFSSITGSTSLGFPLGVAMSVLSLALLIFAWHDRENKAGAFDLQYALVIPITLLISPHLFSHDLTLLILPAFIAINHAFTQKSLGLVGKLKVTAWVGVGYIVGLLRLFPDLNILGVRIETIFLIAISLALAKAIILPETAEQHASA